jgi:hypothetical protein
VIVGGSVVQSKCKWPFIFGTSLYGLKQKFVLLAAAVMTCAANGASAQHYWVDGVVWFCSTPEMMPGVCPTLPHLTQFDVIAKNATVAQIRLSNGTVGYTNLAFGYPWSPEDPDAKFQKFLDEQRTRRAEIDRLSREIYEKKVAAIKEEAKCSSGEPKIGMTTAETVKQWCAPDHINTTVTAGGTPEQWVYPGRGYLYFRDGRIVAIQRCN